jgi:hypothetical protein
MFSWSINIINHQMKGSANTTANVLYFIQSVYYLDSHVADLAESYAVKDCTLHV